MLLINKKLKTFSNNLYNKSKLLTTAHSMIKQRFEVNVYFACSKKTDVFSYIESIIKRLLLLYFIFTLLITTSLYTHIKC